MKRQSTTPLCQTTQASQAYRQTARSSPTDPVHGGGPTRNQWLWNQLPHELAQKIVWYRSPLPGPGYESALATRIELFHSSMVDRKLRRATQPLLRLARWAHEFTRFWPKPSNLPGHADVAPDIETLVSAPLTPGEPGGTTDLSLALPNEPGGQARKHLLLSHLNIYTQSPFLAPLLTRMFEIWLDRRLLRGTHALRLPTDDLPHLLLHADPLLTPPHVYEAINTDCSRLPLHTVNSVPVELLMRHFSHFDNDFQCTLALQLLLLLEGGDMKTTAQTMATLERHGIAGDGMVQQAMRWKSGLLDTPSDQIDVQLGREVLDFLQRARPLSSLACMALLLTFCSTPHLRALESDEAWIVLIQRAMAEIRHQRPSVWTDTYRADYLVACLPEDLGVAAFNRLPAAQRLRFIRKPHCGLYFKARIHIPYLRALVNAQDVEPGARLAALDHFIDGVASYGQHEASALPQLRLWRRTLADEIGGQDLAGPELRHAPV